MTEGVVETGSAGTDEKGTDAGIFWVNPQSPSVTAPSGREPLCGGKAKASLLEGGGAALAVTEGVPERSASRCHCHIKEN